MSFFFFLLQCAQLYKHISLHPTVQHQRPDRTGPNREEDISRRRDVGDVGDLQDDCMMLQITVGWKMTTFKYDG